MNSCWLAQTEAERTKYTGASNSEELSKQKLCSTTETPTYPKDFIGHISNTHSLSFSAILETIPLPEMYFLQRDHIYVCIICIS